MNCPCCSGKEYENCCAVYHSNKENAPTAEILMRSRYSAFAFPNAEYLMETRLHAKRRFHNVKELQEWGEMNRWVKLEIVSLPSLKQVEFKAFYKDEKGKSQIHHELSDFEEKGGKWFYISGEFLD